MNPDPPSPDPPSPGDPSPGDPPPGAPFPGAPSLGEGGFGFSPEGPLPAGPGPQGRYGTGLVAVLALIAVLAGASTLGGGLAVGGLITGRIAEDGAPEPVSAVEEGAPATSPTPTPTPTPEPTFEPTEEPTEEPSESLDSEPWSMTADQVVEALREDYDLDSGLDVSDELCVAETEEDELFLCTMAMDTNLVRVVSFDDPLVASTVVLGLLGQEESEEGGGAVDYRSACHIVLIWFERAGMDEGERATMAEDVEDIVGC